MSFNFFKHLLLNSILSKDMKPKPFNNSQFIEDELDVQYIYNKWQQLITDPTALITMVNKYHKRYECIKDAAMLYKKHRIQ